VIRSITRSAVVLLGAVALVGGLVGQGRAGADPARSTSQVSDYRAYDHGGDHGDDDGHYGRYCSCRYRGYSDDGYRTYDSDGRYGRGCYRGYSEDDRRAYYYDGYRGRYNRCGYDYYDDGYYGRYHYGDRDHDGDGGRDFPDRGDHGGGDHDGGGDHGGGDHGGGDHGGGDHGGGDHGGDN
jgi:hypothetical protein